MELPNENLLDKVLGLHDCVYAWEDNKTLTINVNWTMNKYELMDLMKKWALSKGFYVLSMIDEFGGMALASTKKESAIHNEVAELEAEAVFKICEWILKEKL